MLDRIRKRLTLGYVGILALILVLFGAIVVAVFAYFFTKQQDEALTREAEAEAKAFINGPSRYKVTGTGSEFDVAAVACEPGNCVVSDPRGSDAPGPSLGLPYEPLIRRAALERSRDERTLENGPTGAVRVVSVPIFEKGTGEVLLVAQAAQPRAVVWRTVWLLVAILAATGLGALTLSTVGGLYMSRHAMRPAREAFARQRDFVADASHELKTPLALVKVNAEEIRRNPSSGENREIVDDQLSEIDRMDALLSDLLLLARLDSGRLGVDSKPFDLAVVAAETVERFLKRAAAEGIRLEISLPPELPARGDAARTDQVLAALLDNAVRHTPEGGTVTVSGRMLDNRTEATVADTGPGIPAGDLPRVFERFYRAEEARTRQGGGTGLGLAIARDLARAQNGDLAVRTGVRKGASNDDGEPGGAAFSLTLPRER